MLSRIYFMCLAAASLLALSGCLVPEKFTAVITFRGDGSYTYAYTGTANDWNRATDIPGAAPDKPAYGAKLPVAADIRYLEPLELQAKANGARQFQYLGDGRYELTITRDLQPFAVEAEEEAPGWTQFMAKIQADPPVGKVAIEAQPVYGLVLVARDKQGLVTVYDANRRSATLKDKNAPDPFKLFGVDPSNKLEVRLPPGATVVSSNGKEGRSGAVKTFSWSTANTADQQLNLKFKLP